MRIIVANDNGTMGYVCWQRDLNGQIYVRVWAGEKTQQFCYNTQCDLLIDMKMFVGTPLSASSDINKAKEFMGLDFIEFVGATKLV